MQEMCVELEQQEFPVSFTCRTRLCKSLVAAVDVEAEGLAETEYLGASPKGERGRCGRGQKVTSAEVEWFSQKTLGVYSHSWRGALN